MGNYSSCSNPGDSQTSFEAPPQPPLAPKENPLVDSVITALLMRAPSSPISSQLTGERVDSELKGFKRVAEVKDCLTPQSRAVLLSLGPLDIKEGCREVDSRFQGPFYSKNEEAYYCGQIEGGARNGWGRILWADGTINEGEFLNNVQNGYGRTIHPSGDYFEGEWVDSSIGNKGKYVSFNGATYEGEWKEEIQEGYCLCYLGKAKKSGEMDLYTKEIIKMDPKKVMGFSLGLTGKCKLKIALITKDTSKRIIWRAEESIAGLMVNRMKAGGEPI